MDEKFSNEIEILKRKLIEMLEVKNSINQINSKEHKITRSSRRKNMILKTG
jgi:hypothetical protein